MSVMKCAGWSWLAWALVCGGVVGCGSSAKHGEATTPVASAKDPGKASKSPFVFKKRADREASEALAQQAEKIAKTTSNPVFEKGKKDEGWSILVMTFQGAGAREAAQEAVGQFAAQTGLHGARVEPSTTTAGGWALLQGSYEGGEDNQAKSDLAVVRQVAPGAILVPPAVSANVGSLPDFDLSTLAAKLVPTMGKGAKWTLQVGYYGHADRHTPTEKELAEFRAAAEKAVLELRRGGEEAFYFHSPRGSTVTVGVFDDKDQVNAVPDASGKMVQLSAPRESARLVAARAAHPLNLVNGAPILVKGKGAETSVEQESFLVRVPGS